MVRKTKRQTTVGLRLCRWYLGAIKPYVGPSALYLSLLPNLGLRPRLVYCAPLALGCGTTEVVPFQTRFVAERLKSRPFKSDSCDPILLPGYFFSRSSMRSFALVARFMAPSASPEFSACCAWSRKCFT